MKSIQKITITTILLIGSILYSCSSSTVVETDVQHKKPLLIYAKGDVYKPEWRKVDSLEQNGLTKSALTEVASIYKKAVEEENHEQLLKSLIVKAKFQSYIEEDAFVKTVQELTQHQCISYSLAKNPNVWAFPLADGSIEEVKIKSKVITSSPDLELEMAIAGHGITRMPAFNLNGQLESGQLVEVLSDQPRYEINLYLVYASRKHMSPKVRSFIDFTLNAFAGGRK